VTNDKPGAIVIEGHIQGLSNTRALGEAGIPVIVVDKHNCIARYSKYCTAFYTCPDFRSEAFIDFLEKLAEAHNLKGWMLMPSNDHIVFNLSQHLDRVSQHYKTLAPPAEELLNIYNKQKLLENAKSVDVPCPGTYYPQSASLDGFNLQFPVITKGKFGLTFYKTFGKKAYFAENKEQLKIQLDMVAQKVDPSTVFVQEIIPDEGTNKTISYTAFSVDGVVKTHWIGQKLREHPWTFGTATFTESIHNREVAEQSERLLKKLKYTGVSEVEFLYHPVKKQYMLIEINPRTWLWVGLAKANQINYAVYAYNYLNGISTTYPDSYEAGLKWRNFYTDTVYSMLAMLKGKLSPGAYLKSLNGNVVRAVKSKDDPKPFKAMTRMLFELASRRL
jgi:predicted ATP-grasp superfamily ATP-dependent carboligase